MRPEDIENIFRYRAFAECTDVETVESYVKRLEDALEFYAKGRQNKGDPGSLHEFGCGCCSGRWDKDGDGIDYDSSVIGETARRALAPDDSDLIPR